MKWNYPLTSRKFEDEEKFGLLQAAQADMSCCLLQKHEARLSQSMILILVLFVIAVQLQTPYGRNDVGKVQILHNYTWVDVCDTGWNDAASTLVCKELGFVSGVAECCSALGPSDIGYKMRPFLYTYIYTHIYYMGHALAKVDLTLYQTTKF